MNRYLKYGFLAAVVYVAYLVAMKLKKPTDTKNATTSQARTPGVIGDMLGHMGGVFNSGQTSGAVPPLASGFGTVFAPSVADTAGNSGIGYIPGVNEPPAYQTNPNDTLVPAFLEGSTGGVADDAMTGDAPTPNIGIPGAVGTGGTSPEADPHLPAPMTQFTSLLGHTVKIRPTTSQTLAF